jgi:glycerophosphoryl diester phosphodiesterase
MLIIGHRGAAGLALENTLEGLRAGIDAGADILEFDVRLTKDDIPIVMHDFHLIRTHRVASFVRQHTLLELRERFTKRQVVTLEQALDAYFGTLLLNIEIKGIGTAKIVTELIKKKYIKVPSDWDKILFSSFWAKELKIIRASSQRANLALLHSENPFIFIAHQRKLRLAAVGFHRLYVNRLALEIAKKAGIFTYVYTVNRPHAALRFAQMGIDGVVTNRPDIILREIDKEA